MKIILSLFLTVVCLYRIHCIPAYYEDGRGSFTETHTSYVSGHNDTHSFNPGFKLGVKDGLLVVQTENTYGRAARTYNDSVIQNFDRPADATPPQKPTSEAPNGLQNTPMYSAPTGPLYYPQAPSNGQIYGPAGGPMYAPPMGGTYRPTGPIYGPTHSVYALPYGPPNDQMYVPENVQTNGYPTGSWQTRYPINSAYGNGNPYGSTYGSYTRPNNPSYEEWNSQSSSRPNYQGQRDQSYDDESQLEHEAPQTPQRRQPIMKRRRLRTTTATPIYDDMNEE